jgi:hypothetical protein
VATNGGLSWVSVNVPQYRVPGDTALLQCNYDLGNGSLYSVKWYKDHEEFYRFVPKTRPQATAYRVQGATVDVSKMFFFFCTHSLKIGIYRLSSECGNNDFPHAVFFTLQLKLGEIAL